jgi:DNA polymerase I
MRAVGWFLDAYIDETEVVLWFKLQDGSALKLVDTYNPDFYVKPKPSIQPDDLGTLLAQHPSIIRVEPEERFSSLEMKTKLDALHVWVDNVKNYRSVIEDFKNLNLVEAFYNLARKGDLLHIQKHLFHKDYVPTSKVEIEYYERGRILSLKTLNDEFEVKSSHFTVLPFIVEGYDTKTSRSPVSKIVILNDNLEVKNVLEGEEHDILSGFSSMVVEEDPDFLVSPRIEECLRHVHGRAETIGLNLQLGREPVIGQSSGKCHHCGRILLDLSTYEWIGVAGVVERSRFTMAPPGLSAKWQAGRTIDSRQSYEALKRGILLPEKKSFYNYGMTARNIVFRDRGSLLLAPEAGLHENVGELDFESMFPNIIERFNVSYETVTPEAVDNSKKGFLGQLTKRFLDRRLYFKHLRKEYPRESPERLWCEQRQTALKGILVCIYGFSGCFANRFGNVAVYQEINRIARQVLLQSVNVALEDGFKVVYGDTDSLFLKKIDTTQKDYEQLAAKISRETGLPIALDHHYKFLVFLSQESMPEMEATRRYFGKLTNGELYYRGIDLRRHDTPPFLKEFQEKLIEILFDADNALDVETIQYRKACGLVAEIRRRIRRGEVDPAGLTVAKVLRKPVSEYRSLLPHVAAAKQIEMKGVRLTGGETVNFLYVNAGHRNPHRRVVSLPVKGRSYYDKERYVELALDVAETVLGAFGFRKRHEDLNCKLTDWR